MVPKTVYLILTVAISIFLNCFFTGCSSEKETPQTVNAAKKEKVKKQVKNEAAHIPKSRKKIAKKKKEIREAKIKANPEDIFAETAPVPNFQIMGTNINENSTFQVSVPADDYGLSSFTIVSKKENKERFRQSKHNLPEGFSALPEFGFSEDGMPLRILCEIDESEMAYIQGGVSMMGTQNGPIETSPLLAVDLDPYYIDVTEVTVEQFQRFLSNPQKTGSKIKDEQSNLDGPSDQPILGVKWYEAKRYGLWTGKTLPSEAEWEHAARGTEGFNHPWGNERPTWAKSRTIQQIDPVQSYSTDMTETGVYDLAGNAMEWCQDYYDSKAYSQASKKAAGTVLNNWKGPKKPEEKNLQVVKGNGPNWELWNRKGYLRSERNPHIGFRCVLRLENTKEKDDKNKPEKSKT